MELNHVLDAHDGNFGTEGVASTERLFALGIAVAVLLVLGALRVLTPGAADEPVVGSVEASADADLASSGQPTRLARASTSPDNGVQPDLVADFVGGAAARVHFEDGELVPGDLFLLMALAGSEVDARLYDDTPYPVDRGRVHPEVIESNREAVRVVEGITGTDLQMVGFTAAPGGGQSAGITYAIAYLNIVSDGAFTGDLVVAATGSLASDGYVQPISAIDEKTAAARLAEADVLFTPSIPATELIDVHGARVVGELFRARYSGSTLANERQWDTYHIWGETRPDNDMDVVGIRHIGDVAAYLCGAGSDHACDIVERLEKLAPDASVISPEAAPSNRQRSEVWTGGPIEVR